MKKKVVIRYSEAFKREVVREYQIGHSAHSLRQKYGIRGNSTIENWVRKYAHAGLRSEVVVIRRADEKSREQQLSERVSELQSAITQLTLDKIVLTSSLAEAEELLGMTLKKTDEQPSSNAATHTH